MERSKSSGGEKLSHGEWQREMVLQLNADPELKHVAKTVGAMLIHHFYKDSRTCWPGVRRLAALCGISPTYTHDHVRRLLERGHFRKGAPIRAKRRATDTTVYVPHWDGIRRWPRRNGEAVHRVYTGVNTAEPDPVFTHERTRQASSVFTQAEHPCSHSPNASVHPGVNRTCKEHEIEHG